MTDIQTALKKLLEAENDVAQAHTLLKPHLTTLDSIMLSKVVKELRHFNELATTLGRREIASADHHRASA